VWLLGDSNDPHPGRAWERPFPTEGVQAGCGGDQAAPSSGKPSSLLYQG